MSDYNAERQRKVSETGQADPTSLHELDQDVWTFFRNLHSSGHTVSDWVRANWNGQFLFFSGGSACTMSACTVHEMAMVLSI